VWHAAVCHTLLLLPLLLLPLPKTQHMNSNKQYMYIAFAWQASITLTLLFLSQGMASMQQRLASFYNPDLAVHIAVDGEHAAAHR